MCGKNRGLRGVNNLEEQVLGHSAATSSLQMLRITIEEAPLAVTLRLEGKLIGPWVKEVEQCWRNALVNLGPRTILIDLSAVSFMDTAGQALLAKMQLAGFRLGGSGSMGS